MLPPYVVVRRTDGKAVAVDLRRQGRDDLADAYEHQGVVEEIVATAWTWTDAAREAANRSRVTASGITYHPKDAT